MSLHMSKKYGRLNVAQIVYIGSFQARAAIRDVGRVMQNTSCIKWMKFVK